MKPIIKYAGGKSSLLPFLNKVIESKFELGSVIDTYIETFFGGGALFFDLITTYQIRKCVINDINKELITMYKGIRDNIDEIISKLKIIEKEYNKNNPESQEYLYYSIRDDFNKQIMNNKIENIPFEYLFLNKTCFNGLMRFNLRDEFNSPFGHYEKISFDEINLREVSEKFNSLDLEIMNNDFSDIEIYLNKNTLVYYDPPYRPISKTSNFTGYNSGGFNDDEQKRLANFILKK